MIENENHSNNHFQCKAERLTDTKLVNLNLSN